MPKLSKVDFLQKFILLRANNNNKKALKVILKEANEAWEFTAKVDSQGG